MRIRFWGTRGSIPKPGPDFVRYGGNTSCVEVRSASGVLILLDCGTGAHAFGNALREEKGAPRRGHVFISHTHWDHIQGLPFLAPLFDPDFEWDIYGPRGLGPSIRETLAGQMQYTYFPITIEQFAAKVRYHDLVEGSVQIEDVRVSTHYMNHPALTLGYRIEADGASVVYATDHEPHSPALARGERPPKSADECHYASFVGGADLLIHDAQFTLDEYEKHLGWGHSPVEFAVDLAVANRVRRLALYHHDPMRDDAGVDRIVASARQRAEGSGVEVFGAAEGLVVDIAQGQPARARVEIPAALETRPLPAPTDRTVLIATDPEPARVLTAAIAADGSPLIAAADVHALLRMVTDERPAIVILQRRFAGTDAFELARAIRAIDPADPTTPAIVIVASRQDERDIEAGVRAGVTDWLLWPFKETYARTRMQSWVLRESLRWLPAPLPENEGQRLDALYALNLLDTPPEERFDRYTRIAAELFDVPIALVSLIDTDRQWYKSRYGIDLTETSRDTAFCAHTILDTAVLQVPDALQDARFADSPYVAGEPRVRFSAGAPLAAADGSLLGALCVVDRRPRQLDEQQLALLRDLADLVQAELVARVEPPAPAAPRSAAGS
jgi:phosphoribosyl 1,2-cyclic phosphodiesterase/CheY-like chemotaxis protein